MKTEKMRKVLEIQSFFLSKEETFIKMMEEERKELQRIQDETSEDNASDENESFTERFDRFVYCQNLYQSYLGQKEKSRVFFEAGASAVVEEILPDFVVNNYHHLYATEAYTTTKTFALLPIILQNMRSFLKKVRHYEGLVSGAASETAETSLRRRLHEIRAIVVQSESELKALVEAGQSYGVSDDETVSELLQRYEQTKQINRVFFSTENLLETNWDSVPSDLVEDCHLRLTLHEESFDLTDASRLAQVLRHAMAFFEEVRQTKSEPSTVRMFPAFEHLTAEEYGAMQEEILRNESVLDPRICPTCLSDETFSLNDFLDQGLEVRKCEDCEGVYDVHYKTCAIRKNVSKKG